MRRSLFTKYVILFVGLVALVLTLNAALDFYFTYEDNRRSAIEFQREKAANAAQRIETFIREIERQIGWAAHPQWALLSEEQRRFDYVRLQRQVPAIAELSFIDRDGREQLKVSRLSMDAISSGMDRSSDTAFVQASANRLYFGPVYFHKDSEPHMVMAVAHGGRGGVTVAVINLKLIVDVISQIRVGRAGYAYVVDKPGRLVAHPDMSLVLRGTDMARIPQVAAALGRNPAADIDDARNLAGVPVLSSYAAIPALDWQVFVEMPLSEARQPAVDAGLRGLMLLGGGILIAALAGALLARRMVVPIRALQAGAARIGGGDLAHRLDIRTGDELEALAQQFNHSAEALEESYATLEQRVTDRTRELTESLEQQTATAEILRVISQSPTDVRPVLEVVVSAARRFCGASDAEITLRDETFMLVAAHEGPFISAVGERKPIDRTRLTGRAIADGQTIHVPDLGKIDSREFHTAVSLAREGGFGAAIAAPMMREGLAVGALLLRKGETGAFSPRQIALLETFASQAVIAIENVRLFTELRDALEQQTATAEILQVISQSPTDVAPVLAAVAKAAVRFCGARDAVIFLRDGTTWGTVAHEGPMPVPTTGQQLPLNRQTAPGRAIIDGQTVHFHDIAALDPAEFAAAHKFSEAMGFRAALAAPMLREGLAIGAISLRKPDAGPFATRQIQLLEAFASQAVIAIENVRLFTEIQEKSHQLEIASRHKSQFLANMSHELRTPLNAILGYTEMMADGLYGDLNERATGVLERVQTNGRHLLGLINDVLDLSKIEAGQLTLSSEPYSVADMVSTVVSATESLARTKGLRFETKVASGLPSGTGDVRRLSQVLLNLVGNALKFTDQGGVEIRVVQVGDRFELSVIDTGPGIAAEDQAKIFDEFQQVDNTSTRKKGGTGLGLSISRKIVELHGGRITVQSEPGKGSTFTVSIPQHTAAIREAAQ